MGGEQNEEIKERLDVLEKQASCAAEGHMITLKTSIMGIPTFLCTCCKVEYTKWDDYTKKELALLKAYCMNEDGEGDTNGS